MMNSYIVRLATSLVLLGVLVQSHVSEAQSVQTYSLQTYIVDANPGIDSLEKAVGYFVPGKIPSIIVGFGTYKGSGGLYLYSSTSGNLSGPWKRTVVAATGNFYEHASPFLYPGDTYPGAVASHDGEVTWYINPANQGLDPTTTQWAQITVNPGPAWCHDMAVGDLNSDGLPDVACAASSLEHSPAFASIESSNDNWQTVEPFPIGDGIGLVSVGGGPRINVVGATASGLNWYQNPTIIGGDVLTDTWRPFSIDGGDDSPNVDETIIGVVPNYNGQADAVVMASGEGTWTQGLEWWGPQSDPTQPWIGQSIDSSYRDVHAINGGTFNGVPYFIVGEQEQAGGTSEIAAGHPGIPSRVTMFTYNGSTFVPALELSDQGTHNQAVIQYNGGLLVVGANHGLYGGYPPLQAWYITPSAGNGPTPTPTPSPNATPIVTPTPSPTPASINPGNYLIGSPYVIDGGYYAAYWGYPPAAEANAENGNPLGTNQSQWFTFAAFGSNYTICNVRNGACLTDGGSTLDIGQGTDPWAVNASGSGYTVQNIRTGQYIGAIPTVTRGNVPMSSTPVSIALSAVNGPTPTPTPSPTATPIITPTPRPTATSIGSPTPRPTPTPIGSPTPRPTPTSIGSPTPRPTPSPTPSGIQFDGRTQSNTNAAAASITVTTPSGIRDGDYLLVTVDSWNSNLPTPSDWTVLGKSSNKVLSNGSGDHIALILRIWHTSDPTSYSLGNGQLAYPKAVLRAYHGASAVDAVACSPLTQGTATTGPSFTLGSLPATKSAGEEFVGEWAAAPISSLVIGPSDLGNGSAENTQWTTFDGDKQILSASTVPTAETANIASGSVDWIGCDITLRPQ
jgi:hypothetical protein